MWVLTVFVVLLSGGCVYALRKRVDTLRSRTSRKTCVEAEATHTETMQMCSNVEAQVARVSAEVHTRVKPSHASQTVQ